MPAYLPREKKLRMYRQMLLIRLFEQKALELFNQGIMKGTIHPYIGEEAVAVGVMAHLTEQDFITSTHRGHGHALAKGARPDRVMAELLGRETGYNRGKGGSMHVADFSVGMLGAIGIVSGGLPIATGAGLSIKLRATDQVSVCFFGDGASNHGNFHESLNLASLWKLPVIFVCENNRYAISTCVSESTAVEDIAVRAAGYNMPGVIADGMDVLDVYAKAGEAVARARRGEGPTLLECKTYRLLGHSRGDPPFGVYRSQEEFNAWKGRDGIAALAAHLNLGSEQQAIESEVAGVIEAAARFAIDSPEPAVGEAFDHVYA